jgi:hypothetical protein
MEGEIAGYICPASSPAPSSEPYHDFGHPDLNSVNCGGGSDPDPVNCGGGSDPDPVNCGGGSDPDPVNSGGGSDPDPVGSGGGSDHDSVNSSGGSNLDFSNDSELEWDRRSDVDCAIQIEGLDQALTEVDDRLKRTELAVFRNDVRTWRSVDMIGGQLEDIRRRLTQQEALVRSLHPRLEHQMLFVKRLMKRVILVAAGTVVLGLYTFIHAFL